MTTPDIAPVRPAVNSALGLRRFEVGTKDFLLDGLPFQIISGALHYFRVHPDLWADRIEKAKAMGLNTIETYVAWNAHSPRAGTWSVGGGLDISRFLTLVHNAGMYAIVRPGPFICAEWDNGGLPAWLFREPGVGIRRNEPRFMSAVAEYLANLLLELAPLQISSGGPMILMQVENEFGSFGNDSDYLRALVELFRANGVVVPLTTVDEPRERLLQDGGLPDLLKTASFGSRSLENLATLREHQPQGPLMCAEFWDGWFDHWGAHHHTTDPHTSARELDDLLATGASVNIYMFHGGTNFGFTNGANDKGSYQPTVTSYDYDAPLSEDGHPTAKYHAFRQVIAKYAPVHPLVECKPRGSEPASLTFMSALALWDAAPLIGVERTTRHLPTHDELEHFSGYSLYRTKIAAGGASVLRFTEVRDRAQAFLDRHPIGTLSRDNHDVALALPPLGGELALLVEDQGRVNYGVRIGEAKGLIGPAWRDGTRLIDWAVTLLDFGRVRKLVAAMAALPDTPTVAGPVFLHAPFFIDQLDDLFLDTSSLTKGVAWVNGFNLGRYWRRGPQARLYVPAPLLRPGLNELIVFETVAAVSRSAQFWGFPDLGHTDS